MHPQRQEGKIYTALGTIKYRNRTQFNRRSFIILVTVAPLTIAAWTELFRRYQGGHPIQVEGSDKILRVPSERLQELEERRVER